MRTVARIYLTATLTVVPVSVLAVLPTAAQPSRRKAVAEDSAPAQATPNLRTETESKKLASVLGIEVRTDTERSVGRIIDLLANRSGQVEAAVVEFGGFLGMGTRKIAIDWSVLRLETSAKQPVAILDMTRDQLRAAPEYKPEQPIVVGRRAEPAPLPEAAPPVPPEQSASPQPPPKQAPTAKRKRRHHTRHQE